MNNVLKNAASVMELLSTKGVLFGSRAYVEYVDKDSDYNYMVPKTNYLTLMGYLNNIPYKEYRGPGEICLAMIDVNLCHRYTISIIEDEYIDFYKEIVKTMKAIPRRVNKHRTTRIVIFEDLVHGAGLDNPVFGFEHSSDTSDDGQSNG